MNQGEVWKKQRSGTADAAMEPVSWLRTRSRDIEVPVTGDVAGRWVEDGRSGRGPARAEAGRERNHHRGTGQ